MEGLGKRMEKGSNSFANREDSSGQLCFSIGDTPPAMTPLRFNA